MGLPNTISYSTSNGSLNHKSPIFLFMDRFEYFFSLWFGNFMGIPNPILYFPQMTFWTTKVQFPCLRTDLNNFFDDIRLIIWYLKLRLYECCHSCLFYQYSSNNNGIIRSVLKIQYIRNPIPSVQDSSLLKPH